MISMRADSSDVEALLMQAAAGDAGSWAELMKRYRSRLRRMVSFRMDSRLQGRVDPSDVVQDVCLEAWQHLGARMRDARREVSLYQGSLRGATSAALAAQLLGHLTRPSEAAVRAERKVQLQTALNAMDPIDREVLALRHFEQLTVSEAAAVLGIKRKAAGMRYVRALRRLKQILTSLGGWGEPGR